SAEFIWVAQAGTATFFLMLVIAFVEAAGGIGVSLRARARRHELVIEPQAPPAAAPVEPRTEPKLEPAPSVTHPA
ncbi:MAG TPA: hypothetical protein VG475_10090, partial [Pseudolabrys sp.]|nr:hypothetical protein [Pseudolabrys sp.]